MAYGKRGDKREDQLKSLGVATGLVLLNVVVMWLFGFTPLSRVNDILFGTFFFLGVVVYGALLTAGTWLARKGVKQGDMRKAVSGTGMIQLSYGMFGAGIITALLSPQLQLVALLITGAVTTAIALLCSILVYATGHDFSNWNRYSNYIFLAVLAIALVGSFSGIFATISFFLALTGFIVYLVYEIYTVKIRPNKVYLNAIGLYVAYMGVFVHILQLVIRMLIRRR